MDMPRNPMEDALKALIEQMRVYRPEEVIQLEQLLALKNKCLPEELPRFRLCDVLTFAIRDGIERGLKLFGE